jgi:hypothetical protein
MSAKLSKVKVSLNLPFIGKVEGTWEADVRQQEAAWEMYVELVTRISIIRLKPEEGLLREALSSLHSLFGSTREILRRHGAAVAKPHKGDMSFGYLSIAILNTVLRPLLARWHPELARYEGQRPESTSLVDHERAWEYSAELREAVEGARQVLLEYADYLAAVAGVPSLVIPPDPADYPKQ